MDRNQMIQEIRRERLKQKIREARQSKEQFNTSMTESAAGGAFQGATYGMVDELAGHVEALGSKVGLRGLGGSFSDIRLETPEEDQQSYSEVRKQGRDAKRETYNRLQEANPGSYLAGDIVGSMVAPGGSLAGLSKTGKIAKVGAQGFVRGFGESEKEDPMAMAEDALKTGAASAGTYSALGLIGKGIKKIPQVLTGINEDTAKYYMQNADDIAKARPLQEVTDDLVNQVKSFKRGMSNDSTDSFKILQESGKGLNPNDISRAAMGKAQEVLDRGVYDDAVAEGPGIVKSMVGRLLDDADAVADDLGNIKPDKVKTLITQLDNKIDYDAIQRGQATIKDKVLYSARIELDKMLKSAVPEYQEHMVGLADKANTVSNAIPQSLNKRSIDALLKRVGRGKDDRAGDALGLLDSKMGTNFVKEIKDSGVQELFEKPYIHGSRGAVLGSTVGSGIGMAAGGPVGGAIGAGVGASAGTAMDQFGRQVYRKILDKAAKNPEKLQKYADLFNKAKENGPGYAAMLHNLLVEKNPEYRELMEAE